MEDKLNILLVEDKAEEMQAAVEIIKEAFPGVKLFKARSVQEALKELGLHNMDLLLLDIRLPDGTGFDVTREIRKYSQYRFVHIVFITGEDYDPLETYSAYHCYSFITKPYSKKSLVSQIGPLINDLEVEKNEGRVPARRKVRAFSAREGELLIPVDEILYAELRFREMVLHTTKGDYHIGRISVKTFLDYMDDQNFYRCHQSFAVNINKVRMITSSKYHEFVAIFDNDDKNCIISHRNYQEMKKLLGSKTERLEKESM